MSNARLEALGAGRFRVSGVLDATTAADMLEQSEPRFAQAQESDLEMDLGGVGESDSAGLALMIEWMRMAKQSGKQIRFAQRRGIPYVWFPGADGAPDEVKDIRSGDQVEADRTGWAPPDADLHPSIAASS